MSNCLPCGTSPVFSIFLGDSKTLALKALYVNNFLPLDLTGCTEIVVPLPNADGTFNLRKLSLSQVSITSPAVLGQFSLPISRLNSALLQTGELQNLDVSFTIGGDTFTVRFANCFSVFEVD